MKYMNKYFAVAILIGLLATPRFAIAQYYSQNGNVNSIVVDKKVRSVSMDKYFDNISASTYTFREGTVAEFQVNVENTGNTNLYNVEVKDLLPSHLALVFYPGKADNNVLTWNIDKLAAGEKKTYVIRATIKLESNKSIGKQINRATATSGSLQDSDTATYYVAKAVTPVTGSSNLIVITMALSLSIGGGLGLRKLARGY